VLIIVRHRLGPVLAICLLLGSGAIWSVVASYHPEMQDNCGIRSGFICDAAAYFRESGWLVLGSNPAFLLAAIAVACLCYYLGKLIWRQMAHGAVSNIGPDELVFASLRPPTRIKIAEIESIEYNNSRLGLKSLLFVKCANGKVIEIANVNSVQARKLCDEFQSIKRQSQSWVPLE
jgi:hypothetical protein